MGESRAIICPLVVETVPELYEIELECNRPPWSEQLLANEFSHEHARILGARAAGHIVGFVIAHAVLDEAHILNFGVRSSFRARGLGRALLEELLSRLAEEGVRVVTLEVRASNVPARTLYESVGFGEVGIRPQYYSDNGEDALILRLDLMHYSVRRNKVIGSS